MKKVLIAIGVIILVVIIGGGIWASQNKPAAQRLAGFTFNWFRYLRAPQGTLQTQTAPGVAAGPADFHHRVRHLCHRSKQLPPDLESAREL